MDRKRIFVALIIVILVLAMILPVFASVFAAGEESVEIENENKERKRIPPFVYIIIGIIFLIVAFILKKKDDKKEKDPMEDIKLLKYYEDTKKDSWNNK